MMFDVVCLFVQIHFESNQFEQGRSDGRKLLKNTAVLTVFSNSSSILQRRKRHHSDYSDCARSANSSCTDDIRNTRCVLTDTVSGFDGQMSDVPECCVQDETTVTEYDVFISEDFQNVKKSY